jgi:type IV secretory pathway VirB10-like protein
MCLKSGAIFLTGLSLLSAGAAQSNDPPQASTIPLTVPAGVPLRLYLTKRVSKKVDAPVEAKVLEPVFAFDHQVIPAGATVLGRVEELKPVSKWQRTRAILGGDFTPLHVAPVEFTNLLLPDGREIPLQTEATPGLHTIVPLRAPKKKNQKAQNQGGVVTAGKQQARDSIQQKLDQVRSIPGMVRGPGKKELVEDYLFSKLPYHPQYVRSRTRFDAVLQQPLQFGSETVSPESVALLGSDPLPDTVVQARLVTPIDSAVSQPGQTIDAILAEPVFGADHKLILPEGTHLAGTVVLAKKARWLHRSGQIRFNFQNFSLPEEAAHLIPASAPSDAPQTAESAPTEKKLEHRTQATLAGAEATGTTPVKVDSEGGVQAQQSKTRFLAAAASVLIASRAAHADRDKEEGGTVGSGSNPNVGGRTIGGGFGLGLVGTGLAQTSPSVGMALGYYGMAWTVYSTVFARGPEVQFGENAVVEIRFNTRTPSAAASHFSSAGTADN